MKALVRLYVKIIGIVFLCFLHSFLGYSQSAESLQENLDNKVQEEMDVHLNGYILTKEGDTLKGKIKLLNDFQSCRKIKLLMPDSTYNVYTPATAIGYVRGNEIFELKETYQVPLFYQGKMFMKRVKEGKLKMYLYSFKSLAFYNNNYIAFANIYESHYVFLQKSGEKEIVKVTKDGFRRQMCKYFSDRPELARRIKNKEFKYDDLMTIVWLYNNKY